MDLIKDIFKGDKVIWIIYLFLCLISIVMDEYDNKCPHHHKYTMMGNWPPMVSTLVCQCTCSTENLNDGNQAKE